MEAQCPWHWAFFVPWGGDLMATDGATLYQLQLLDSEADAKRRRLAAVETSLGVSEALRQTRQAVERAEALAHGLGLQQLDLELELGALVDKADRAEELLYGGTIRNAKELEEHQAELTSLRRRQQNLEDDLLGVMIKREEAEVAASGLRTQRDRTEDEWAAEQARLRAESEALRARLAELEQARAGLLAQIEPADLATYRSLRQRKAGIAVALIADECCSSCGVAVTQGRRWQIREGKLVHCSNCERILVLAKR
jgi:predicted  nucleic acid-binding Zn-ribbon protein